MPQPGQPIASAVVSTSDHTSPSTSRWAPTWQFGTNWWADGVFFRYEITHYELILPEE